MTIQQAFDYIYLYISQSALCCIGSRKMHYKLLFDNKTRHLNVTILKHIETYRVTAMHFIFMQVVCYNIIKISDSHYNLKELD